MAWSSTATASRSWRLRRQSLGHRPRAQHAVLLEPQVEVRPRLAVVVEHVCRPRGLRGTRCLPRRSALERRAGDPVDRERASRGRTRRWPGRGRPRPAGVDEVAARGAVAVGVADPHAVPLGDRVAQQRQRHHGVRRRMRGPAGSVLDPALVGRRLGRAQPVDEAGRRSRSTGVAIGPGPRRRPARGAASRRGRPRRRGLRAPARIRCRAAGRRARAGRQRTRAPSGRAAAAAAQPGRATRASCRAPPRRRSGCMPPRRRCGSGRACGRRRTRGTRAAGAPGCGSTGAPSR